MKSQFADQDAEATSARDTADDHCWRDHRMGFRHLVGELEVLLLVLLILVLMSVNWATPDPPTGMNLALAQRPLPVFSGSGAAHRYRQVSADDDR